MKLFWKIFFSAVLLSAFCVALSGHGVISSGFRSQLKKEAGTARDYGVILSRALFSELGEALSDEEELKEALSRRNVRVMDEKIPFAIVNAKGEALFSSAEEMRAHPLIQALNGETAGWTVAREADGYWLWAAYPILLPGEKTLFIETARDVTDIYEARREQYQNLARIMALMSVGIAVAAYALARFLLRDVNELIFVAREIAGGKLGVRARTRRRDEIALLSRNFNAMADHLEAQMRALAREAERKELFVGAFSHELKTPLTSIIGYADLLRRGTLDEEQRDVCADYIFSEGKRLERLSMRLLELIVLRQKRPKWETVEIKELLFGVKRSPEPRLAEGKIRLSWQVEAASVRAEADLMKTVFLNLLDNAFKAIDGEGTIGVRGEIRGKDYRFTVEDSGRGMTRDELRRITDAFYMADRSRARSQGGAGLGLAICEEILKIHGFSLNFESEIGRGTRAVVTMKGAVR